jgi:hypothetical protein
MANPSETKDYPETGECGRCGEENGKGGTPLWNDLCESCDGEWCDHEQPKYKNGLKCSACVEEEDDGDEEETEEEKAVSEMVADLVKGGMTEKEAGKLVGAMIASSYLLIAKAKGVATALREGRVTPDEGMVLMKALSEDVRTAVKAGRMTAEDGMRMYAKLSAMVMVEVTNAIVRG